MSKLVVFNNVSVDGYFVDMNGDMSWAHSDDPEWGPAVAERMNAQRKIVFSRTLDEATWNNTTNPGPTC